jgi:hypothetical protein
MLTVRKVRYKSRLRYSAVRNAIKGSAGIISVIAQKLDCDWHTVDKFISHHPKLKRHIQNEREKLVDLAESKLTEKVETGDNWAIGRVLDGPGKRRGWYPKSEVEHGLNKETTKTFADWIKEETLARKSQ